jgi:apolipoprotein D and lipocalin family protein
MNTTRQAASAALLSVGLSACSNLPPLPAVEHVDLERFMGDWYVIANIPTFLERDAHNAVESYELAEDGSIATTFTFRAGSSDGPKKTYHPRGFVRSESNAIWGMQFIWPIKADYRIAYLDPDYTVTVIGRNKRDYVWIMARSAEISMPLYNELVAYVSANGYDVSKLQRVPQQW